MNYTKTIVCLANSRKTRGRCIAGKEWKNGNVGKWVRPVSKRDSHEVSEEERRYEDGHDPQLLDILSVPCDKSQPLSHQCENHLIDSDYSWTKRGELPWDDIPSCLDHPNTLWNVGEGSYTGVNNRIDIAQQIGQSLYLISVSRLSLIVGIKAPEYPDSKRAVRGEFKYRGNKYKMDITDPVIEQDFLKQPDGQYDIANPVMCISLSDPYEGYYYKLIAAVLYKERFQ